MRFIHVLFLWHHEKGHAVIPPVEGSDPHCSPNKRTCENEQFSVHFGIVATTNSFILIWIWWNDTHRHYTSEHNPQTLTNRPKQPMCKNAWHMLSTEDSKNKSSILNFLRSFKSTHVTVCVSCINVYQADLFTTLHWLSRYRPGYVFPTTNSLFSQH